MVRVEGGDTRQNRSWKINLIATSALVLAVSVVSGCAGVVTATKQTGGPTPQATFQLSSTSISFGSVAVGKQSTQSVSVTNTGNMAVNITQVSLSNSQFTVSGVTPPMALAVGQSSSFTVGVNASAAGNVTGTLTVTGDSGSSPVVANLSATAVSGQPQLSLGQSSINFGTVAEGSKGTANLTLNNTGSGDLIVSMITMTGASPFTISGITTPKAISAGQSAQATVTFTPTTSGAATGTVSIASNDPTNPTMNVALSGTASTSGTGQLSVSPTSFNFGSIADGQTKSQAFTITNTGTASLTISQIAASGTGFSVSGLITPATVAVGGTATFSVVFAPTSAGNLSGSISVTSDAPNSPNAVALSGTGTAASVSLVANPSSLGFGGLNAGSESTRTVTISNSVNGSLTISQIAVNAKDFKTSGMSTPVTLAAGQNTTMSVSFDPMTSENVTGNITISSSQGASAVIPVSGSGLQAALTITPGSASFGNVTMGVSSTQTIQLTNSGTGALSITQVSVAGSGFSDGSVAVPINLNPGQSSSFNVQFLPGSAGAVNGSITVASNAPSSPATVTLSGTGVASIQTLSFSTSSLGFGNVNAGASSSLPVTVTNTGNANVKVSQISESGSGFTMSGASAPVTLSPNQSMTFDVNFSPSGAGADSGSVTVTSNATGSPKTITLSGTGVQASSHTVTLNWSASTSTVSGYNVYRSATNGSGYGKINGGLVSSLSYVDSGVQNGTTYYYVTTAVDSSGNESVQSNQASAVIP